MSFADDEVCGGSIVSVAGVLIQRRWQSGGGERGEGRGWEVEGMNQAESVFKLNWLSVELFQNSAKHQKDPHPRWSTMP